MSHEQLLSACKFALSAIEVQARICSMNAEPLPAQAAMVAAAKWLQTVIEAETGTPIIWDELLTWGHGELTKMLMEE